MDSDGPSARIKQCPWKMTKILTFVVQFGGRRFSPEVPMRRDERRNEDVEAAETIEAGNRSATYTLVPVDPYAI